MQPLAAPPIPERVRTLAATAVPTHVALAAPDRPAVPARGGVDHAGRPVLLALPGDPLHGTAEQIVVTVDLVASRELGGAERPRGMLKTQGWLESVPPGEARQAAVAVAERCPDEALFEAVERAGEPGAPRLLRVDVGQVIYLVGQDSGMLDAEDYLGASPDPLLDAAESMIRHVNSCHRAQLQRTAGRLAGPIASDVWLWELDRYGATLRAGLDDPHLIRLPWSQPAACEGALESALRALIQP
ncbi:DUF2470 domain-containing protein [Streptosporangium sp. KLBMP 9127]|nr:DUF2470 domain-containing protein [Streptosporangium sp. KLBMP 9127]